MQIARIWFADGTYTDIPLAAEKTENGFKISLPAEKVPRGTEKVDFLPDEHRADAGESGYLVLPRGWDSPCDMLCMFEEREDYTYESGYTMMPWFGMKTRDRCFIAVFTGLWSEHSQYVTIRNGRYAVCGRFTLDGQAPCEDLAMEYFFLTGDDADYSGMCLAYRKYQEGTGRYLPLLKRDRDAVCYALEAPEVRIRLGWKPVPTPVEEQTRETEPPMHVAATFDRVGEIMDAFRKEGVEKAEFCLVGWNKSGHDGRYPEMFPVEERLGGEEGLRRLIQKAQAMGYRIVCHTNSTDCYSIAEDWDPDTLPIVLRDGSLSKGTQWSGGRMYNMCPHAALPLAERDLPRVRDLGFSGLHYIDVIGVVTPRKCYSETHPATRLDYVKIMRRIMEDARDRFGGFQTEGGFDCYAKETDFALYISFGLLTSSHPLCTRPVPLWQLVYHGAVMSNPTTETVNYPIKDWRARLKYVEYGGRPALYLYSRFVTPVQGRDNWMGDEDLTCDNEEDLARTANVAGKVYRDFQALKRLLPLAFLRHDYLNENVTATTYEDGTRVICNYGETPFEIDGVRVPPHEWHVFDQEKGA